MAMFPEKMNKCLNKHGAVPMGLRFMTNDSNDVWSKGPIRNGGNCQNPRPSTHGSVGCSQQRFGKRDIFATGQNARATHESSRNTRTENCGVSEPKYSFTQQKNNTGCAKHSPNIPKGIPPLFPCKREVAEIGHSETGETPDSENVSGNSKENPSVQIIQRFEGNFCGIQLAKKDDQVEEVQPMPGNDETWFHENQLPEMSERTRSPGLLAILISGDRELELKHAWYLRN